MEELENILEEMEELILLGSDGEVLEEEKFEDSNILDL